VLMKDDQRPLLALTLDDPSNGHDEEHIDALLAPISPSLPPIPIPQQPNAPRGRTLLGVLRGGEAERILANGGLSIAVLQVGSRLYQLIVDLQGVPMVSGIGQLKSLILDSWILTSNGLAPQAGQLRVEEAVVRTLLMLMIKRLIGIRQLGPVRDVMTMMNFMMLASALLRSAKIDASLAATLAEIASLPGLFYTAMARLIVDKAAKPWIVQHNSQELRREARILDLASNARGALGKNGEKLTRAWSTALEDNPELRSYTRKHAIGDRGRAQGALSEFLRQLA
jgi:hypothetical protein